MALAIVLANAGMLAGSSGSNFVTADEVRQIPAGLVAWETVTFSLANDSPPLARMVAAIPLLVMGNHVRVYDLQTTNILIDTCMRDREEGFGAQFAYDEPVKYLGRVRLARMAGFVWWLLGAWVIGRWARELYGDAAMLLALALWGFGPNVLACEQVATPALPAAVAVVIATDALRRYLKSPSWSRASLCGISLGIAQLVEFTSLILYVIWPLLALVFRSSSGGSPSRRIKASKMIGQAVAMILVSVWLTNVGYGLQGSGSQLGEYEFVSRALGAETHPSGPPSGGERVGNRFRGTPLGSLVVPFPADYVEGLDRRWHEWERSTGRGSSGGKLGLEEDRPLATLGAKVPLGVWGMVLWSFVLAAIRRAGRVPWEEELGLWLPGLVVLSATARPIDLMTPSNGIILIAPFAAIIASKLACFLQAGHWRFGWIVMALLLWAVGSSLASYPYPRGYLNEAAGRLDQIRSRMAYAPVSGEQDLLALKAWLWKHPETRLRGMAICDPVGPRIHGLNFLQPPTNPGPALAGTSFYTRRTGPYPGDYALDPYHLAEEKYGYFAHFVPIARVGSSIFIYQITEQDAGRVRQIMGLPALDRGSAVAPRTESGLLYRTFVDSRGAPSHYALFVPPEYDGDRRYPMILFLHGWGDQGETGRQYTAVGLPPSLEFQKDGFGFFVLCPQGRSGSWDLTKDDGRRALELVAAVQKEYRIDPKRIYLSGVSSGASAVWDMAAHFPDRWAAIAPMSTGFCNPAQARLITNVPCWCFHNSHDPDSSVYKPRSMIQALRNAGGTPKYTEFFGINHNTWDRAYRMTDLYDWLLRHQLP